MRTTPPPRAERAPRRRRNTAAKGRSNECLVRDQLSACGAISSGRSAGSKGTADNFAEFPGFTVRVQVKTNGWPSPAERAALDEYALALGPAFLVLSARVDDGSGGHHSVAVARRVRYRVHGAEERRGELAEEDLRDLVARHACAVADAVAGLDPASAAPL